MVQRRSVVEKVRTSANVEVALLEKFQKQHNRYGDFSHFVNESLRRYLKEQEIKELQWGSNSE